MINDQDGYNFSQDSDIEQEVNKIILIHLKGEADGKVYHLFPKYGGETTVRQLTIQVEKATGVPIENQRLLYQEYALNVAQNLKDTLNCYGMKDGATIYMLQIIQGENSSELEEEKDEEKVKNLATLQRRGKKNIQRIASGIRRKWRQHFEKRNDDSS